MVIYGTVAWFGGFNYHTQKENNYGFIETSDGTSYFVHKNAIEDGTSLEEGDWVSFIPRERILKNGQKKIDAQHVNKVYISEDLSFDQILLSGEKALVDQILVEAFETDYIRSSYLMNWFQKWLTHQSREDETCEQDYFTKLDSLERLEGIIKDIQWKEYNPNWGVEFLGKVDTFDLEKESLERIQYVNEWVQQQTLEFILSSLNEWPKWLQTWELLLDRIKDWLENTNINEQMNLKENIPYCIKKDMMYWHLLEGSEFINVFNHKWNSIVDDQMLKDMCLQKWLQCYDLIDFEDSFTKELTGKTLNWALKRYKCGMCIPLNWNKKERYVGFFSTDKIKVVEMKIPISLIWNNIPSTFFAYLSTKVQKKEIQLQIPVEAWAMYLRNLHPTDKSIQWIRKHWKPLHLAQKLTFFALLGEKWHDSYYLHVDFGGREALFLWEDMNVIQLNKRGLWWEQFDITGKCSWYILAFQKGYKNVAFLEKDISHPLLQSFQLLYKHYIGIQPLQFTQWNSIIQDYYIELASNFNNKELKMNTWLWPACDYKECDYCEGKLWKRKDESIQEINRAYCPRKKSECLLAINVDTKGSRFKSYKELPHWTQWRMPEILQQVGIIPSLGGDFQPEEYVIRFGGWLNRLLELQERLKCRKCKEPMRNDFSYSKVFTARYTMTIASCKYSLSEGHDHNIYFNDCWNHYECNQMIDSRDNKVREKTDSGKNNYYLCTECGAAKGPQHYAGYKGWTKNNESSWDIENIQNHFKSWYYVPGDKCPVCASENMERISRGNAPTHARCNDCLHTIRIPRVFLPIIDLWEEEKKK